MKHLFLIGGFLLLLLVSSCGQGRKSAVDLQRTQESLPVNFQGTPLYGSQILKGSKIISLSSEHDEALIAKVEKLLVGNDRYFVMDRRTNRLMAFDGRGKFISSTARYIGEGPDSYLRIMDAAIDNVAQKVYVHCDAPYCIMVFDLNLQLEKKISLDYYMQEIAADDKCIYGIRVKDTPDVGYELIALDKVDLSSTPVVILESSDAVYGAAAIGKHLTSFDGGINACLPFDNVIYQISNKKVVKHYPLDFGEEGIDFSDIKDMTIEQFYNSPSMEHIWSIVNVYSSDSILFFGCNRLYSFTLNRNTSDCMGFSFWRNDLMPYSSTQTLPVDGLPCAYAYVWPSSHVMNFKTRMSDVGLDVDVRKMLEGYEEEDNPLIVVCELK